MLMDNSWKLEPFRSTNDLSSWRRWKNWLECEKRFSEKSIKEILTLSYVFRGNHTPYLLQSKTSHQNHQVSSNINVKEL